MKQVLLIFLLLLGTNISSQIKINGTVFNENTPLQGAAIYIGSSLIGTTSDKNGEFTLKVESGTYKLIISFLGYESQVYELNTLDYTEPLTFNLKEKKYDLDEITIYNKKKRKRFIQNKSKRTYFLDRFKLELIGRSKIAKKCIIINPEVIQFTYDSNKNILRAFANKPIELEHKLLGYTILYELVEFKITRQTIKYAGYSRYKLLKGNKYKQKRWAKNRLEKFNGSDIHLYKSIINKNYTQEGFILKNFSRFLNPERPSEKEIKIAYKISNSKKNKFSKSRKDSANVVLERSRKPKYLDQVSKTHILIDNIDISLINNKYHINFDQDLSILYIKEAEEENYNPPYEQSSYQKSFVFLNNNPIILNKNGSLFNYLDIYYENYWGFERLGDALPLDYKPSFKK